jgi:dTDP-4-dehydrorhamnose 3,5-epimerase
MTANVPDGVVVRTLKLHADPRGMLAELHRNEWGIGSPPTQWTFTRNNPNSLRGVHVHVRHADYLIVLDGRLLLALHDIRREARTRGKGALLELDGANPTAIYIPPGVAHGWYSPGQSMIVNAQSHAWDPNDDVECRYDCPELGITWPASKPLLSTRDGNAGDYANMVAVFEQRRRNITATPLARSAG